MKFYTLFPEGVPENPHLFPMMRHTFIEKGHSFVDRIEDCDVVLMDLHVRQSLYNENDFTWLVKNLAPIITFDEWDRGGMSTDVWPYPLTEQQKILFWYNGDRMFVNFCRLLNKPQSIEKYQMVDRNYYYNLYPYEKPILYEEALLTTEQLFEREYDIVYISNTAPSREAIGKAILEDGRLKCHVSLGAKKLPFDEFVNWHKRGKLFISSGGGGYTDERKQNLFSIAGIIQEETDQLLLHPFSNLENCIKIQSPPTKEDLDTIYEVVNNKEWLWNIYKNGYDFMKQYYSASYIASDILSKIEKHLCQ